MTGAFERPGYDDDPIPVAPSRDPENAPSGRLPDALVATLVMLWINIGAAGLELLLVVNGGLAAVAAEEARAAITAMLWTETAWVSVWAVVVAVLLLLVRTRRRSIWVALLVMQGVRAIALLVSYWLLDLGALARGYGVDSGFFVYQGLVTFGWSTLVFIFLFRAPVRAFFDR